MKHTITKSMGLSFSAAFIAAALFGSVSTIAKPVLAGVDPFLLSSLVYLISAMFFSAIIALRNITSSASSDSLQTYSWCPKKSHFYLIVLTTSIIGATIAPAMFFLGLGQTTASDTSLLSNGETIFSIIIATLFFKEKLKPLGYLAVLMVLAGLVITTNLQFHSSLFKMNSGNILVLGATALWGLDNNICRYITYRMDAARLVQMKSVIGGSILLIFAVFVLHVPLSISLTQVPQIIVLGAVGFGTSLYFFLISMKTIGIVRSVLVLSLSSVFGLVFASLLLSEVISVHQIIAVVVMIAGIYLINIEKEFAKTNNTIPSVRETSSKDG